MSEEETTAVPPELEDVPSGAVGDIDLDIAGQDAGNNYVFDVYIH